MAFFPDHSVKARLIIPSVEAAIEEAQLELTRARSKLHARVPAAVDLAPGETYDVDTGQAYFRLLHDGEVSISGPLQVVGTWLATNETWVWSFANPSIPPQASRDIECAVKSRTELAELASCVKFDASLKFSEDLAQYVAVKAGWLGAFAHREGDTEIFLALKLTPLRADGQPVDSSWCSFCGRHRLVVAHMIAATDTHDHLVCDECIKLFIEARDGMREPDRPPWRDHSWEPPCFFCGGRTERIMTDYTSVCLECVDVAEEGIRQGDAPP